MKTVNCEGIEYLEHEAEGNAARWIMPMAKHYCVGNGIDCGYSKHDWKMPGAFGVEPAESPLYDAMNLPNPEVVNAKEWDYIFSSHMVEHYCGNWYNLIDYWLQNIRIGGILFLYLPHASQRYWQPRNNRKHVHSFTGDEISEYLRSLGHQVFVSGVDLNHSFCVVCEKKAIDDRTFKWGDGKSSYANLPYVLESHLNMTDEQKSEALKMAQEIGRAESNKVYSTSTLTEVKPFYQQNEEDIKEKINKSNPPLPRSTTNF